MNEMTHETVSELLTAYLAGELDRDVHGDVEGHLASCEACTLELAGLVLLTAPEVEPLNEVERATMVRAVRAEAGHTTREPLSIRFGRRFAPALGAAALLAVIAVGVVTLNNDERPLTPAGGADTAEDDADAELFDAGQGRAGGGAGRKAANSSDAATNDVAGQPESEQMEAAEGAVSEGATLALSAAVVVDESFARARFDPSVLLAAPLQEPRFAHRAARDLALSAPDPELARTIRGCATSTLDSSARPLVPTYAAYFTNDDIVVIGFVWTDPATERLNYELHGWRGPDCDRLSPIFRSGELP